MYAKCRNKVPLTWYHCNLSHHQGIVIHWKFNKADQILTKSGCPHSTQQVDCSDGYARLGHRNACMRSHHPRLRLEEKTKRASPMPACMLLYPENSLQNASKSRRRILEYSRTTMPNPSPTHGGILLKRSYKPEYRLPFVQPNLNTPHPVTPYPSKEQTTKPPRSLSQRNPRPNVCRIRPLST
jgi:hypothetical protein